MDGVIEVADVDGPHSNTDQGDNLGQLLAKLVQLGLQRSFLLLGGSHLVTDLADLSGHSSGHSYTDGLASSDVSALQRGGEEERGQNLVVIEKRGRWRLDTDASEALTEKSMFFLSWLTALGSGTGSVCLITLTDSPEGEKAEKELQMKTGEKNTQEADLKFLESLPVRMDWSTRRVVDLMEIILMSAGTLSPTVELT